MTDQDQSDQGQENQVPRVNEDDDEEEDGVNDPRKENEKQN